MFDEHFERSVDEILYDVSLLQLGEMQKTSCCYPGHFQQIYRQNLFAPITIEWTRVKDNVTANQMILSAASKWVRIATSIFNLSWNTF